MYQARTYIHKLLCIHSSYPRTQLNPSGNSSASRCWENASCHVLRIPLCEKDLNINDTRCHIDSNITANTANTTPSEYVIGEEDHFAKKGMYVYNAVVVVYSQGLGNCRISLCSFGSRLSMKGTVSKIVHGYLWLYGTGLLVLLLILLANL